MSKKTRGDSHEDRKHAPLPPSASSIWLHCAPAMAYVRQLIAKKVIKKRESGEAAKRGTRIHETSAPAIETLIKGKGAKFPPGEEGQTAKLYAYFCEDVYNDAVVLNGPTTYGVEAEAWITDECWGSSDFWCYSAKRFIVVDLKTGRNPVEAKGNTQLLIYAIGVMRKRKLAMPKEVELIIFQPGNGPDNSSRHVYTFNDFLQETKRITAGVAQSTTYFDKKYEKAIERDLVAGDHCEWCDALGVCEKAKARALSISSKNFSPVPVHETKLPMPAKMEPDQIGQVLDRAPMFQAWLEAVQVRALELIGKGHRIPGRKVVQKITRRAWESKLTDAQIAKRLKLNIKEISETRRKSPAQVEELLDKNTKPLLASLVFKPMGEPCVVA
jgi:hypothetical protein